MSYGKNLFDQFLIVQYKSLNVIHVSENYGSYICTKR